MITSTVTESPEPEVQETSSRAPEVEGEGLRAALEQAEERAPPPPAHSLKHDLQHPQPVSRCFLLATLAISQWFV